MKTFFSITITVIFTFLAQRSYTATCEELFTAIPKVTPEVASFSRSLEGRFTSQKINAQTINLLTELQKKFGFRPDGLQRDLAELLDPREIDRLAGDSAFAAELWASLQKNSMNGVLSNYPEWIGKDLADFQDTFQQIVALKYVRGLKPSPYYTSEQFTDLARLEGLQVELIKSAYRLDSRGPELIDLADGFYPNPDLPKSILTFHSRKDIKGSGFVSFSWKEGNEFNLTIAPVFLSAKPVEHQSGNGAAIFKRLSQRAPPELPEGWALELVRTYEYRTTNLKAVRPNKNFAIEEEAEVVTNFASFDQIDAYREVYILAQVFRINGELTYMNVIGHEFSKWLEMSANSMLK